MPDDNLIRGSGLGAHPPRTTVVAFPVPERQLTVGDRFARADGTADPGLIPPPPTGEVVRLFDVRGRAAGATKQTLGVAVAGLGARGSTR